MNRASSSSDGHLFSSRSCRRPQLSPRGIIVAQGDHPGFFGNPLLNPVTLPKPKLLPLATGPVTDRRKDAIVIVLLESGAMDNVCRLLNSEAATWQVAGLALPTSPCTLVAAEVSGITVHGIGIHRTCCHHSPPPSLLPKILKFFSCTETQTDTHTCHVPNNQHQWSHQCLDTN
ncbi:hypothetical protein SETIT_3G151600v2 [Setaria italica]|uniref:Uncharacterized protein n=1 Tax=Setaria italica TaxID=4555 RepID=A0A368QFU6_SETIT|nr:hypothetical protein SETIT_3G151600v2 [Setaria italica]